MPNGYRTQAVSDMRPLIQFPSWDGKLVLAGMFLAGYYSLVFIMAWRPLPATNAGLVRDAMLTLGPVVGLIFGSLFRTTGAEERSAAMRSADFQTALTTATPLAPDQVTESVREGVKRGLESAEPVQTTPVPATPPPLAADGAPREWLDPPQTYEGPDVPGLAPAEDPSWT